MSIESTVARFPAAARQRYVARLTSGVRADVLGVGALTAVIAAIYSVFALVLYATYHDSSYDLVIFDQAIRSYSHFHLGVSVIKGLHNGFGPTFSVLGDHFSPIDIALAPLYWIFDGPQTLLVAQPVLFALAIPWLWVLARRAFGGVGRKATAAAYLACVAYGLSWPLAAAVVYDYHEVAFAPLLTAIALERLQAGRLRAALVALGLLLLVKEDMGLLVAGIGVWLAVSPAPTVRRQRLVGVILVVCGIAYTAFATYVLIPAFGGQGNYYWAYSELGKNVPQAVVHILRHPWQFVQLLFSPATKFETMRWLFEAFALLPLLSPVTLAALPLLVERMAAGGSFPSWWSLHFQYNAYLAVVLVVAAIDGAARLDRWLTRLWHYLESGRLGPARAVAVAHQATPAIQPAPSADEAPAAVHAAGSEPEGARRRVGTGVVALACCGAMCLATMYSLGQFPLGRLLHATLYQQTADSRAAAAADDTVPNGVVVAAANDLGPELSRRDTVLMWDGDGYTPPFGAPWVVADIYRREMTFGSLAEQRADVTMLRRHGYKVVFERDGYLVLRRSGPPHLGVTSRPMTFGPAAAR